MGSLRLVVIPESVTTIAEDAFSGTMRLVIQTPIGSYAAEWADVHHILTMPAVE